MQTVKITMPMLIFHEPEITCDTVS